MLEEIPRSTLIATAPLGEPIVSMVVFNGVLFVATTRAVFKKVDDEFHEMKFVMVE